MLTKPICLHSSAKKEAKTDCCGVLGQVFTASSEVVWYVTYSKNLSVTVFKKPSPCVYILFWNNAILTRYFNFSHNKKGKNILFGTFLVDDIDNNNIV